MENVIDGSSIKTAHVVDEDAPAKSQWLPKKGRTRSPPLKKVIVYNRENKSMKVQPEDSLDRWPTAPATRVR